MVAILRSLLADKVRGINLKTNPRLLETCSGLECGNSSREISVSNEQSEVIELGGTEGLSRCLGSEDQWSDEAAKVGLRTSEMRI